MPIDTPQGISVRAPTAADLLPQRLIGQAGFEVPHRGLQAAASHQVAADACCQGRYVGGGFEILAQHKRGGIIAQDQPG